MFNQIYTQGQISLFLISITTAITFLAWHNPHWQDLFIGYPYRIYRLGEWYRCFTQGFIHANFIHLLFNMYTLYSFGRFVEHRYSYVYGDIGALFYILLYVGGIVSAGVSDVWMHANNDFYGSLGASAGVSAVVLSGILFNPFGKILLRGFIPLPSWLYGIGYLLLSYYSIGSKTNINHLAHLVGSLFGVCFTFIAHPDLLIAYLKLLKKYLGS